MEFAGRPFLLEVVIYGEGLEAGLGNVFLEELGLTEAGDFVVDSVEDEDGNWEGGLPGLAWDDFGELSDQGRGGIEADAAAAVGLRGFDFVGGFSFDEQGFEAAAVEGLVGGVGDLAAFEEVIEERGSHAAGEDCGFDMGGLGEEEGEDCRAGAVAEEDCWDGAECGEGVGVGAEFLGEVAGGAVAGGAFGVADAGFFDAEGGVAGAGEGVEEGRLGGVFLGVAAGAGDPEDGGFGLLVGGAGEQGAAAVVLGLEFAVFDGDAGGLFGGRGEVGEGD